MKRYNKPLLALLVGAMSMAGVTGMTGLAEARPGGHYGAGGPCYQAADITPEMHQMMKKAYNDIAPLMMELRAKQDELTAKIYGGADDKTIKDLTDAVSKLQGRVTEARAAMQKQFAKAGVPLHAAGCPGGACQGVFGMRGGMQGGMMGHGMMGGCQGGMMGRGAPGAGHGVGHGGGHDTMPAPAPGNAQ